MRRAALLCLALLAASSARADDAAEAKKYYELGVRNYDLGLYQEALEAFEQAYDRKPLPGFFFNIGQCHRKLDNYDQAIAAFQRYLDEVPEATNRKLVQELIAEVEQLRAAAPPPDGAPGSSDEVIAGAGEADPGQTEGASTPAGEAATGAQAAAEADPGGGGLTEEDEAPVYQTWWFWTAVGGSALVVAAGVTTAVVVALNQPEPAEEPSLGRVDLREVW